MAKQEFPPEITKAIQDAASALFTDAIEASVDQVMKDRMAEMEAAIRADERERIRPLVGQWRTAGERLASSNAAWSSHFYDCANELERLIGIKGLSAAEECPVAFIPGDPEFCTKCTCDQPARHGGNHHCPHCDVWYTLASDVKRAAATEGDGDHA